MGEDKAVQYREGVLSYQLLTGQTALRPRRSKGGLRYCQPSEFLQIQKEKSQIKAHFFRSHGVESLSGLSARVMYYQAVLTGLTVLCCIYYFPMQSNCFSRHPEYPPEKQLVALRKAVPSMLFKTDQEFDNC